MERELREIPGISWVHPHAAPYLYIDVSALGGAELIADRLLAEHGVATLPGRAFQGGDHIRVPFGGPSERIVEAAGRMARAFEQMAGRSTPTSENRA
jgi:aspartate aminotransferase